MSERSVAPSPSPVVRRAATLEPETASPFLHDRGTAVYNPLTGVSLEKDGEAWKTLSVIAETGAAGSREVRGDPAVLAHLRAARFLIEDAAAEARRSHLLFLSLET